MSAALPPAPRVPAAARRLRRRRLGGAGLRGHRRPAAGASVGPAASCRRRCARSMPCTSPSRPTPSPMRRRRPTGCSRSSAAGPSWRPWPSRPRGSTNGAAATSDRLAELESGWPDAVAGSTLLHCDVRSDNLLVTAHRRRVRGLAARLCRRAGLRPGRLGALRRAGGRPGPRRAPRPVRSGVRRSTATSLRRWSPHSAGSWCATRCSRPRPGCRRCVPSRRAQGAVALAWLRRLTGW